MRRHKIDILQRSLEKDDYGEVVDTWTNFKTNIWAKKEGLAGKEFYSALTAGEHVDAKFSTSFFTGVKSDMRIKEGGDTYEIIGTPVNLGEKNMELLFIVGW